MTETFDVAQLLLRLGSTGVVAFLAWELIKSLRRAHRGAEAGSTRIVEAVDRLTVVTGDLAREQRRMGRGMARLLDRRGIDPISSDSPTWPVTDPGAGVPNQ